MSRLEELTVEEFVKITASNEPAPGGGSISALAGSLAAALAKMVASLTVGREKYAAVEKEMQQVDQEAGQICQTLLKAVHEDSESFNQYMAALGLPKGTEEEKAIRREAMQEGLKAAVRVPLGVAETALNILPLAELCVTSGNANAVTDGLVAAMMARSGILGALMNVRINLQSIKDVEFVEVTTTRVTELTHEAVNWERRILASQDISKTILEA